MARAVWQATIADFEGNIQPGAQVYIRDQDSGTLVSVFDARTGGASIGNPFPADDQGFARGYVPAGRYRITATFAASSREWKDVVLMEDASTVPDTVEGDFLLNLDGTGLSAQNFAELVRTYANVPTVRGACFVGFNRPVEVPVNDVSVPVVFDGTIRQAIVLTKGGDGDFTIDVWKKAYASYPPAAGDSITGGNPLTVLADTKLSDSTLTGWTKTVSAGDVLTFHLSDSAVFTQIAVFLIIQPVGAQDPEGFTDARVEDIVRDILAEGGITVAGDTYSVTAQGASAPVNLWSLIGQPTGTVTVNYETPPGGIVSATPGLPALDLRGFHSGSTINIVAKGPIIGHAGDGGSGASIGNTFGEAGGSGPEGVGGALAQPGRNGGTAIIGPGSGITFTLSAVGGYVFGGGGGGGGGGATLDFTGLNNAAAGGGGGAGAGGARGGRGGAVAVSNSTVPATATAAAGTDSTGGLLGDNGTGGTGASNGSGSGGTGGDGGDYGADGSSGASPTTFNRDYAGAAGGTAGKAIDLNGGSVSILDGNDSTHIKGAVS